MGILDSIGGFFSDKPATTTQTSTGTSTANPWAPVTPGLTNLATGYAGVNTGLTPEQLAASKGLWSAAQGLPNMMPQSTNAVQSIFNNAGMIPAAYQNMQTNLNPIAGMSSNPYQTPGFSDALQTLTNNITGAVKGVYAGSGRSPSGAGSFAQSLGRGLMQGEAPIIQDQYNKNLGNIMGANQMLQNAGINTSNAMSGNVMSALQGAGALTNLGMAPATAQWNAANQIYGQPIQNMNQVLSPEMMLAGAGGTTTSTQNQTGTQTPAQSGLSNLLGLGSTIASFLPSGSTIARFLPSDTRLKTDIKDIGRTHDNQPIYSYRLKGSPTPQIGMLADQVQQRTPDAVATDSAGFKHVRYDRATRKAATMGMLKAA